MFLDEAHDGDIMKRGTFTARRRVRRGCDVGDTAGRLSCRSVGRCPSCGLIESDWCDAHWGGQMKCCSVSHSMNTGENEEPEECLGICNNSVGQ